MALEIRPQSVSLHRGEAIAFQVINTEEPVPVENWVLHGGGSLSEGVYTAPPHALQTSRAVVTARTAAGSVSASIEISTAVTWIAILWAFFVAAVLGCAAGIYGIWPATPNDPPGWKLMLMAAFCGALGACLHGINSLSAYVGAGTFKSSWALYYVARPIVGGLLGPMIVLVFRANLIPNIKEVDTQSWLAVSALAAISGLFADKAVEKLKQVVDVLFSVPRDERPDKLKKTDEQETSTQSNS